MRDRLGGVTSVEPDTCDLLCLDLPKAEAMREALPPADELEQFAAGAKALGDPTRLAVALALRDGGACLRLRPRLGDGRPRSSSRITSAC